VKNSPNQLAIKKIELKDVKPVLKKCLTKIAVGNDGKIIVIQKKRKLYVYYPEKNVEKDL
jgi:hypothetical protein